MNFNIQTCPIT